MRAIAYERYGGPEVLHLEELETPVPADDQVLVRLAAAGVATGDRLLMRGEPFFVRLMFGLRKPKLRVLGSDVAGRVEAVGERVTSLRPGDEVFGSTADAGFGGFADYVCVPPEVLVDKPESLSFEEAAAVPGSALAALQGLRDAGELQAGQTVLINGASGGVGTYAVQIAKAMDAEVTGVCSTGNVDLVRSLGADRVVDYTREDFRDGGTQYDLVLDCAAFRSVLATLPAVRRGGSYVMLGGSARTTMEAMALGSVLTLVTGKRVVFFITKPKRADLETLRAMSDNKTLVPVIDRTFALPELAEAMRYLESGSSHGKVVATMDA
jgi:NADPH:quinone reductase-like Zn-dependent oxidoreductase